MRIPSALRFIAIPATFSSLAIASSAIATPLSPGDSIVINTPTPAPFAGETQVDSHTATFALNSAIIEDINGNFQQVNFTFASGDLTTNVFRTSTGSLDFFYTLHSQFFQPPAGSLVGFPNVAYSNLQLNGFAGSSINLFGNNLPNNPASGSPLPSGQVIAVRSSNGDAVNFLFSSNTVPQVDPPSENFMAAHPEVDLFVSTDATAYQQSLATLPGTLFDNRGTPDSPTDFFSLQTFTSSTTPLGGAGLPEPASLFLLPLALTALTLRSRPR